MRAQDDSHTPIGRKFADRDALWLFARLMTTNDAEARNLIPHGFEHLVCSADGVVAKEAFDRMLLMMADDSDQVIGETLLSLARVTRNGRSFASSAARLLRSACEHESPGIRSLARSLVDHLEEQSQR